MGPNRRNPLLITGLHQATSRDQSDVALTGVAESKSNNVLRAQNVLDRMSAVANVASPFRCAGRQDRSLPPTQRAGSRGRGTVAAAQLVAKLLELRFALHARRIHVPRRAAFTQGSSLLTNCQRTLIPSGYRLSPTHAQNGGPSRRCYGDRWPTRARVRNRWSHQPQQPEPPGLRRD